MCPADLTGTPCRGGLTQRPSPAMWLDLQKRKNVLQVIAYEAGFFVPLGEPLHLQPTNDGLHEAGHALEACEQAVSATL
jgi:hypothetical protein